MGPPGQDVKHFLGGVVIFLSMVNKKLVLVRETIAHLGSIEGKGTSGPKGGQSHRGCGTGGYTERCWPCGKGRRGRR